MKKPYRVNMDLVGLFDPAYERSSATTRLTHGDTEKELAALKNSLQSRQIFEELRDKVASEISKQNLSKSELILSLAESELEAHLRNKIQFSQRSLGGKTGGRATPEYRKNIERLKFIIKTLSSSGIEPKERSIQDYILEHIGYDFFVSRYRLRAALKEYKEELRTVASNRT